jgi:hypothetical protein
VFSLVEANLPNLIPAKFSSYTVVFYSPYTWPHPWTLLCLLSKVDIDLV